MSERRFYLREDAYFEPLINHWYAWPYLIPPVTQARFIQNNQLRIMKSFVANYQLHIMASKESALVGGEFMNCTEDQVSTIEELVAETNEHCADLLALSDAIKSLEQLLNEHDSGKTIEELYPQVPELLRGYVELQLDSEHRTTYRLIEPLIYKSKFWRPDIQTVSFGLLSKVDERPFVFSTPRLADDNHLQLAMNFTDERLDKLLSARTTPITEQEIDAIFADVDQQGGLHYKELFTEEESAYPHQPVSQGVRLQYTGHAGFLVETSDVSILVDPVIAPRAKEHAGNVCSFSELPATIDYICLTHNHQDHVNIETLLQLRHKTQQIIVPKNNGGSLFDPSIKLLLKQLGFNVMEIEDLDEIPVAGGKITGIPFLGEHGDLNIRTKTAWLIELQGKKMFFGADSANPDTNLYRHMLDILKDIDTYAIGMECVGAPYTWLYGSLHTKKVSKQIKNSRRLNGSDFEQAWPVVDMLRPKELFIYALGREPWYKYFMGIDYDDDSVQLKECNKLIDACKDIDIPGEALFGRKTIQL